MSTTKIEWTDATWNPVHGCTPVSEGCTNCYAKRMANRLRGRHGYPVDDPFAVTLRLDRLDEPLRWRKPRRVFVCSMGDLFHERVPFWFIARVFGVMTSLPGHTFQVLTKRPRRMREYVLNGPHECPGHRFDKVMDPVPDHIWLGVSAEDQAAADERIPILLDTPAAVRFVSCEPLLDEVGLTRLALPGGAFHDSLAGLKYFMPGVAPIEAGLDWVIAGSETGPGARWMNPDWARSLREQCEDAGVPFFFKRDSAGLRLLDGVIHEEWPGDLAEASK